MDSGKRPPDPIASLAWRDVVRLRRGLSSALASEPVDMHPSLRLRRLKGSSYNRFIGNVQPYVLVLALAHFLECYRDELASYASPANPMAFHRMPCVDVEHEILFSGYDEETVFCCTTCSNASSIMTLRVRCPSLAQRHVRSSHCPSMQTVAEIRLLEGCLRLLARTSSGGTRSHPTGVLDAPISLMLAVS